MRPQQKHWLADNETERSPRRLIIWDTEGDLVPGTRIQRLRCWVAREVLRKGITPKRPRQTQTEGIGPDALSEWIVSRAKTDTPLWVVAHGASYDLTITRLPLRLIELGWELTSHALTSGEPWAHFRQGEKTIRLIDSHSHLPRSLAYIGERLGIPKRPLPDFTSSEEEWLERCRQDVEILTVAFCEYLDWWDRERLGAFADTGPGSGWHAMRHRKAPDKVLIDPEPEGRSWDRQAIYGGRRDCWRKGVLPEDWYVELDLVQAHLSICASQALPVRRVSAFEELDIDTHLLTHIGTGVIAEAEIETDVPRFPLRLEGAITYPVGRFWTVLCSPELAYARELGCLRRIGRGRRYRLGFAMEGWGRWLQSLLAGELPETPPAALVAAKGWSRTVIGRWAMRTGRTDFELPSTSMGWGVTWGRDHPSGAPRTILTLGHRELWLIQDQEADSSFPAVLAWVQSHTRVLLDRLIAALPPGEVILCDTDGVLVRLAAVAPWLEEAAQPPASYPDARALAEYGAQRLSRITSPASLQVKTIYRQAEVIGPQHFIADDQRKLAGVAPRAVEIRPKVYAYETWPKLAWQMAEGSPHGYVNGDAAIDLTGVHVARWEFEDGCCEPLRATLPAAGGGASVLIPPDRCSRHLARAQLAQHPVLMRVVGEHFIRLGPGQPALAVQENV